MNISAKRSTVPWDDLELAKLYQLLTAQGVDPERIQQVRPRQIVYSYSWTPETKPTVTVSGSKIRSFRVAHSDPSIVTGLNASIIDAEVIVNTGSNNEWRRVDDVGVFSAPRNPLDYVRAQISPNATTKIATAEVPLSHLVNAPDRGWMPSVLDFVPGGNFAAYEILLHAPKEIWFSRLDLSLTAVQLIGL